MKKKKWEEGNMEALRKLPKVDKLLFHEAFEGLNKKILTELIREYLQTIREEILQNNLVEIDEKNIIFELLQLYHKKTKSSLKPLINATGIILHTNLGRAVLSKEIFLEAQKIACSYNNLEFDEKSGKRGERYKHVSKQFKSLLGVEDVLIVNNNASAVFLILNTFAKDKKVILSRGELVEIGGSFRIPEVMKASTCILHEVGTTNKTKLSDYEEAIDENTAILMKVHKSNFSMKGFTESVDFSDISKLAKEKGLLDYYDVGGAFLKGFGIKDESLNLEKILLCDPSLVSFSGDKLFGSIQAGIIVGKKQYIQMLKNNQILRMFRVDKLTLSLLEATMKAYLEEKYEKIPTLTLLKRDENELKKLCEEVIKKIQMQNCEIIKSSSYVGGGTMPDRLIPSMAIYVKGDALKLQNFFRKNSIIGRIENEKFLLDFRSIFKRDLKKIISTIKKCS